MKPSTERLTNIYRLYDDQIAGLDTACRMRCSDCCTANVTMTRLEAMLLVEGLPPEKSAALLDRLTGPAGRPGFRPRLTTNGYAEICMSRGEPPEDSADPDAGPCPLLEDDLCTIYPVRPFGCRCMLSSRCCREKGAAEIDEFTLTVNTVFLQFIEHIDAGGYFGNLADVLHRVAHREEPPPDCISLPNRPIPALMVPPEHREKIRPLLSAFNRLLGGVR